MSTSSNATGLSVGVYVVTVTDSTGCNSGTDTVKLVNPTAPTLTITSTPEKCHGQSIGSATVTATGGTAPYTYKWTPGGGTTASITGLSAGSYTVLVTDALGCQSVDLVTVAQPFKLSVGVDSLINVKCNGGNNGAIYVSGNGGTPAYSYLWSNGNTTTSEINLGPSTFTITVTDANGCTADTILSVNQPPPMVISLSSFDASCGSSNGYAYVSNVTGGTGPYTYLWTNGNPSSFNFGLSAGLYCCTITDANGCTDSACVTVGNVVSFTLNISPVVNILCFGGSTGSATVNVTGHTPPYTYSWSTSPPQTNATATGLSAGTYTVTVKDNSGCSSSDVVTITQPPQLIVTCGPPVNIPCNAGPIGSDLATAIGGTGAYAYSWTPGGQTTAAATGLSAGTYTITVKDVNGCSATASVTISKVPSTIICHASNQMICIGQTVVLSATASGGTPAYTYTWNNATTAATYTVSPITTTVYTVTATDANGCTSTAVTDTVKVRPPLILTVTPQSISVCSGSNVTLTAIANGGDSIYTYTWMPGNINGSPVIVNPTSNTVYTVTVTDACGTPSATATVSVNINPIPVAGFTEDSDKGCYPICVTFKDTSAIASGNIAKWAWNFGDRGKDTLQNPTHCYITPGSYSVNLIITSDSGCTSSLTIANLVQAYAHPQANFSVSPQPTTIMAPTIYFTDLSSDIYGIRSWSWRFNDVGDSGVSAIQNPVHTYTDTGTFCPTLMVTNLHGCVDSVTECLVISPQFTIYIPDAFTPNGDGRDDIFMPKGEALQTYEMYIFDRWGMKLFHSTNLYTGWDGTYGGKICQEDTYVYLINIKDNFGKEHSYLGKVTLLQ